MNGDSGRILSLEAFGRNKANLFSVCSLNHTVRMTLILPRLSLYKAASCPNKNKYKDRQDMTVALKHNIGVSANKAFQALFKIF